MIGPISSLPDYMRISKSLLSKNPEFVALEFVPIRLGKRHVTYFTRPRAFKPFYWEYNKDQKRAYLSDQPVPTEKDITTVQDLSNGIIRSNLNHFGRLASVWFDPIEGPPDLASLLSEIPFG